MFRLPHFTAQEMMTCRAGLKAAAAGASSMEAAAERLVGYLYDELGGDAGEERASVLVRLYKTHPFGELDEELQAFARRVPGGAQHRRTFNVFHVPQAAGAAGSLVA